MDKNKIKGIFINNYRCCLLGSLRAQLGSIFLTCKMMDSRWLGSLAYQVGLPGVLILLYSLIKYPDSVYHGKAKEKAVTMPYLWTCRCAGIMSVPVLSHNRTVHRSCWNNHARFGSNIHP